VFDPDDVGLPLTAFVSIKPFDAAAPRRPAAAARAPERDRGLPQRRGRRELHPQGAGAVARRLEDLLQQIRTIGSVSTRTTVVLSTPTRTAPRL
jgi:Lrp/AsnC family leucine-responsive transcriptional regulator